jgi:hypothetical protein
VQCNLEEADQGAVGKDDRTGEAALERKTKATIAAPKKNSEAEVQLHASYQKVRVITAAAPGKQDCAALRREHLASE